MIDSSKIFQLKSLKPKNNGRTNFYECCDLTKKLYLMYCVVFCLLIFRYTWYYISCIRNSSFDICQTSWTNKSMANNLLIHFCTSKLNCNSLSCSIWRFNSSVYFFWHEALFWCNGAASLVVGAWSFLIRKCQQQNEQSHFVQMLHNTTDSSNSEVLIMFSEQFAINPLIHDEDLSYTIF